MAIRSGTVSPQLDTAEWEQALGEQFRTLRISRGLDQTELAALAGVSLGSVKGLEQATGSSLKTIVRVARALDREDWLRALNPRPTVSPLDVLRSQRTTPRRRVYRKRAD
jgi:transcriptional regulator with XRE-family HTH domain